MEITLLMQTCLYIPFCWCSFRSANTRVWMRAYIFSFFFASFCFCLCMYALTHIVHIPFFHLLLLARHSMRKTLVINYPAYAFDWIILLFFKKMPFVFNVRFFSSFSLALAHLFVYLFVLYCFVFEKCENWCRFDVSSCSHMCWLLTIISTTPITIIWIWQGNYNPLQWDAQTKL